MIFLLFPFFVGAAAGVGAAQVAPPASEKADANPHLTAEQVQTIKSIRAESEKKAAPFASRLASVAKQIYENMLSEKEDEALRRRLSGEMDEVVVELLAIKGQSIREMVRVLTPEQRQFIRREMQRPGAPGDLSELIMKVFNITEK
jgi:Spy/CpxP family protein refolding chaperone